MQEEPQMQGEFEEPQAQSQAQGQAPIQGEGTKKKNYHYKSIVHIKKPIKMMGFIKCHFIIMSLHIIINSDISSSLFL
jgi:primosomal replication protein N